MDEQRKVVGTNEKIREFLVDVGASIKPQSKPLARLTRRASLFLVIFYTTKHSFVLRY